MQEIDALIDLHPELSVELISNEIRNKQAHDELCAYNANKLFVYKHPFLKDKKAYDTALTELYQLKQSDPSAFISECHSIIKNLNRYQSKLKGGVFKDDDDKKRTQDNIHRYTLRNEIAQKLVSS